MKHLRTIGLATILLGTAAGSAAAQTSPSAPVTDLNAKPGTLSDKLSGTGGVIKPTGNVDPEMHKPAPQTGTTPVIKPGTVAPQSGNGTQDGKGGLD